MGLSRVALCLAGLLAAFAGGGAQAWEPDSATLPDCPGYAKKFQYQGKPYNLVSNNNSQVLSWKSAAQNQFEGRAHVQGAIVRVYPDRNGHHHFAIQIGPDSGDTVEIVYNEDFGATPPPSVGMQVEACGDYITSVGPSPGPNGEVYPASPDGALVHWVHMAPPRSNHTSGYLVLGGVLTGQEPEHR